MFNTTTIFVILGILVVVSIILSIVALTKKGGSLTGPQGPAGKDGVCRNAAGTSCTGPQGDMGPRGAQGVKGDKGTCDPAACKTGIEAATLVANDANNGVLMNFKHLPSCRGFPESTCSSQGNPSSLPIGTHHVYWLKWDGNKTDKVVLPNPTDPADLNNCFDTFAKQYDVRKFCKDQQDQKTCENVIDPDPNSQKQLCVWNDGQKGLNAARPLKSCTPVCMPGNKWVPNQQGEAQRLSSDQQSQYFKGSLPLVDGARIEVSCCIDPLSPTA